MEGMRNAQQTSNKRGRRNKKGTHAKPRKEVMGGITGEYHALHKSVTDRHKSFENDLRDYSCRFIVLELMKGLQIQIWSSSFFDCRLQTYLV